MKLQKNDLDYSFVDLFLLLFFVVVKNH